FHVALKRDHDVLETHVAVDNAQRLAVLVGLRMGVGQAAGHAAGNEHRQFLGQDLTLVRELVGKLLKIHSPNEFHGDKRHAVRLAQLVGLDDVGVNQVRHQLRLANEVLNEHLLAGEVWTDNFDGDAFDKITRPQLLGLVHNSHTTLKNFADDVVAEFVLDRE